MESSDAPYQKLVNTTSQSAETRFYDPNMATTSSAPNEVTQNENEGTNDAGTKMVEPSSSDQGKKKQPPYLEREVKIEDGDKIDPTGLLKTMKERFETAYVRWEKRCKRFKLANLIVTVLVIILQLSQVIVFQLPVISEQYKNGIATVLPATTGALLAIQLKLAWSEKSGKCKKAARVYNQLAYHMRYRLEMAKAGGKVTDAVKIWNLALISESKDVPAFLAAY